MSAPVALSAAVEEARKALAAYDVCYTHMREQPEWIPCLGDNSSEALRALLAALDSDDRLERAVAALWEIAGAPCSRFLYQKLHSCLTQGADSPCGICIARRYFAKEERP